MAGQSWRGKKDQVIDELALAFSTGRDVHSRPPVDEVLIPYDLWNTEAHNLMLHKQKIISKSDLRQILNALITIRQAWEIGEFQLDPELEDVHMNIETLITEQVGVRIGGKVHTGRSRNDQVSCDMRMFLRERLLDYATYVEDLSKALLQVSMKHLQTVMPGHTHRRPATVTSVAHWLTGHAQAMIRDLERIRFAYQLINCCPLGAAAAYGTSWPIDRRMTADLLGFDSVQENTMDCISNRWESEAQVAIEIMFHLNHCSTFAQDLITFSTQPFRWVSFPDEFTTGSSIMPQKRNPDFAEILIGKAALVQGMLHTLMGIGRGQLSGYNRESQLGKQTIVELMEEVMPAPLVLTQVVKGMHFYQDRLAQAAEEGHLNAVDFADFLVKEFGLSFRESYGIIARAIGQSKGSTNIPRQVINQELRSLKVKGSLSQKDYKNLCAPSYNMEQRKHTGGPAPSAVKANIKNLKASLQKNSNWLKEQYEKLDAAWKRTKEHRAKILS